jgi:outer membrane protein OmpA-like peptidoglycan-associated protein
VLNQHSEISLLIEGHTDNTGSDILNKALSIARANATAKFLTKRGIDPQRLTVKAYGASRPLVSNDDERDGREINRRIEMIIQRSSTTASIK